MNEHQTLDLRSPWVISIHELVRRPGELKEFHREIPAPANVGIEMIGVPEGSPVDVDLRLESVSEGVLATGVVSAELVGECSRCLGEVREDRQQDALGLARPGAGGDDDVAARPDLADRLLLVAVQGAIGR